MFYIDDIKISPNPVEVKGRLDIEVALYEESAGDKRYPGRYCYRYAQVDKHRSIYASGKNITINSQKPYTLYEDIIFGKSVQNEVPSPDNPVGIVSIKDSITQKFTDTKSHTQTLAISLLDELRGIKVSSGGNYTDETGQQWLCDTIELKSDGTGQFIKRLKEITLTGDEAIPVPYEKWENIAFSIRITTGDVTPIVGDSGENNIICNRFETRGVIELAYTKGVNAIGYDEKYSMTSIFLGINVPEVKKGDIESFRAFAKKNQIKMIVALKKPIETPLSDEIVQQFKQIKMYQPTTNIYTVENAEQKITCLAERQEENK